MRLAIVIPIFNEEQTLPELARRIKAACDSVADLDWRVLYVDDGSRDRSIEIILEQRRDDARFGLIELSRNFGHQAAITAGLAHAEDADAVVVMDGDLQDPPELIPEMVAQWRQGRQVIRAVRRSRQERGLRRLGFELFHRLFKWFSGMADTTQTGVFSLLDRQAVRALNHLPEQNRFMPGLRSWIGFDQGTVEYDRAERVAGEAKQTFTRLTRYALDAFFSFSYKPLRLMTWAGLVISAVGFVIAIMFAAKRLLGYETAETGFTTIIVCVL